MGPEHADVQREGQAGADELARDVRPEVQGQDHGPEQPDPDRGRGAVPVEDETEPRHHGPVRAEQAAVRRGGHAAQAAGPLVKKYWALASDEIRLFKNGDVVVGARWPLPDGPCRRQGAGQGDHPEGGRDGLGGHVDARGEGAAPELRVHVDAYISTPKVQAQQAHDYGETPVNKLACTYMDKLAEGSCAQYHANAPGSYYGSIKFWKTPVADCGNGKKNCMDYRQWVNAWTEVKGWSRSTSGGRRAPRFGGPAAVSPRPSGVTAGCAPLLLLLPPLAWFSSIYIAALAVLFVSAFWRWTRSPARSCTSGTSTTSTRSSQSGPTAGHRAHGRHRRRRHGHRRGARVPVRVLHGEGRDAADTGAALRARPAAAVVELPRARLRLEGDPRATTASSTGRSTRSGSGRQHRLLELRRCGSSSPTSGCPS